MNNPGGQDIPGKASEDSHLRNRLHQAIDEAYDESYGNVELLRVNLMRHLRFVLSTASPFLTEGQIELFEKIKAKILLPRGGSKQIPQLFSDTTIANLADIFGKNADGFERHLLVLIGSLLESSIPLTSEMIEEKTGYSAAGVKEHIYRVKDCLKTWKRSWHIVGSPQAGWTMQRLYGSEELQ